MSSHDEEIKTTPDGVEIIQGPDGLREADNPMPRWMTMTFIGLIIWGIGYLVLMPGMGINLLNYSQYDVYDAEVAAAEAKYAGAQGGDLPTLLAKALNDPHEIAEGKAIYSASCAACHGADGSGAIGPSLSDDTWLYGSTPEEIAHTIAEGTDKGMPPFKTALSPSQLAEVTAYLESLK